MKKADLLSTLFVGIDLGKNDAIDAFLIAAFARVGRITTAPWRGSQFLALQCLTRHRLHIAGSLTREKTYMLSNIFLNSVSFLCSMRINNLFPTITWLRPLGF